MMHMAFWTPVFKHDLSSDTKALMQLCKREPKPILLGDFMRLYRGTMTPLAFIEKWESIFSPPTRTKMRAMAVRIDLHARKQAILFVAKLKHRVKKPETSMQDIVSLATRRALDDSPRKTADTRPPRRRSDASFYLRDAYVENPRRAFVTSLRDL